MDAVLLLLKTIDGSYLEAPGRLIVKRKHNWVKKIHNVVAGRLVSEQWDSHQA